MGRMTENLIRTMLDPRNPRRTTFATPPKDLYGFTIFRGKVVDNYDLEAPVLCVHCKLHIVPNFERRGRWGHIDTCDPAC